MDDTMTIDELAQRLNVSRPYVRKLLAADTLRAITLLTAASRSSTARRQSSGLVHKQAVCTHMHCPQSLVARGAGGTVQNENSTVLLGTELRFTGRRG